jgi:hypothetical protein
MHQGGQVPVVRWQTPVTVIIERGIHPENAPPVVPLFKDLLQGKKCAPRFFFFIPCNPYHQGKAARENIQGLFQQI